MIEENLYCVWWDKELEEIIGVKKSEMPSLLFDTIIYEKHKVKSFLANNLSQAFGLFRESCGMPQKIQECDKVVFFLK